MQATIDTREQQLFLAAVASIAAHQVQFFIEEPEQRPLRALALAGLSVATTFFLRAPAGVTARGRRGGIALAIGAGPAFGAVMGHIVPLIREGEIAPASETALLNLGGGSFLVVLGVALLRQRARTKNGLATS